MSKIPQNQVVAITGHRIDAFSNVNALRHHLQRTLVALSPEAFIQGMASGVDLNSGVIAIKENIPTISVKPWAGHKPTQEDRYMYDWVWRKSTQSIVLEPHSSYPGPWVYFKRNEFMVDNSEIVLGVWDGRRKGGTYSCLQYAQKQGKPIYILNAKTWDLSLLNHKI